MEVLLAVGASLVLQVAVALPDLPRVGGEPRVLLEPRILRGLEPRVLGGLEPRVLGAGLEEELVLSLDP